MVMLPYAPSWGMLVTLSMALIPIGVIGLLAEWQRRRTLVALVRHAPEGTVVIHGKGLGGPAVGILGRW
jgi:hypothetical protein